MNPPGGTDPTGGAAERTAGRVGRLVDGWESAQEVRPPLPTPGFGHSVGDGPAITPSVIASTPSK